MRIAALSLVVMLLALGGCARHVHHHHAPGAQLEAEHELRDVVIVNVRPAKHRTCWKHRHHWHCRR